MLLTVTCPAKWPSTSIAKGYVVPSPGLPVAAAAPASGTTPGAPSEPGGTVASHGRSQAALRTPRLTPGRAVAQAPAAAG